MADAAKTTAKQREILQKHAWKPGQSGNPNGRPKGARQRFSDTFVKTLADDFEQHGVQAVEKVRKEDTSAYLRVIASLLPKDVNINAEHRFVFFAPQPLNSLEDWQQQFADGMVIEHGDGNGSAE